jgi:hypothetical protein
VTASDDGALRAGAGLRPVDWLVAVPDVASRLRRQPPDRVLVLGCGDGVTALDLAVTFPTITVYGIDDDAQAVAAADAAVRRSPVSRLLDSSGLAVLDSPVPLQQSMAQAAGVAHVQRIGESAFGCPASLLRR